VGIGTEGGGYSDLDVELLQQIAKPSGPAPLGNYIHVSEASGLPDILTAILQDINNCLTSALAQQQTAGSRPG
jgi:hypothetical protein